MDKFADDSLERGASFLDDMAESWGNGPQAEDSDGNGWPDPLPLSAKVEPELYPLDALPDPIRAAVEEVADFVKAPVPLVASSALAALSLAIQPHADAKRADKLHGPVGLFLLTIADSGERKSTCDGFFTRAIRDHEEAQAEAAKPILKDHRAAIEAWEAKRGGVKEKIRQLAKDKKPTADMESALRDLEHDQPEAPRIPRLLYADATPEALAYGLAKQWPSGGVVSAEAGIVFGSHGMGKDSVMRNLGLLNQLWDGTSLTIDRRSTESFTVRGARLTVALQVQEPTLREFFTRSGALARGTGFLARFLVAWPESTQGQRPFTEAPANWPHLAAFNRRIAAILDQPAPIDDDGALTPPMLPLTPEAKAAWVAYHDAIERELSCGGELYDVRDVASKSADNAARLAALFQMFEGAGGAIGLEALEGASRITAWHLNEARRFFGELALPAELADAARLDSWLIEYCRRERTHLVPTREAQRLGPVRDKEKLTTALRELEELDRVRVTQEGRRKTIKVNPALVAIAS
jgi:putative DNA primase/helicase